MSDKFNFEALNASHNSPYPAIEWGHGSGIKLILDLPNYANRNLAAYQHDPALAKELAEAGPTAEIQAWAKDWAADRPGTDAVMLAKAMTVAQGHTLLTMPKWLSFFNHQTFWSTVALTLMAVALLVFNRRKADQLVAANRFQSMIESLVLYIRDDIARPNIHHHADAWVPFLSGMFILILTCNLFGIIPLFGTATGDFAVTLGFAVPIFLMMLFLGFKHNGPGFFIKLVPVHFSWKPMDLATWLLLFVLEVASLVIKPAVLAIRLFANMLAGHTLLLVFASLGFIVYASDPTAIGMTFGMGIVGWVLTVAFYFLELMVALVQAYVFVMLSAVFIGSSIQPEH